MGESWIYGRLKQGTDFLPDAPVEALEWAWEDLDVGVFIHHNLAKWLYMALSYQTSIYHKDAKFRAAFLQFYSDLLPFIEASFCYFVKLLYFTRHKAYPDESQLTVALTCWLARDYSATYLDYQEVRNPLPIMTRFCKKYQLGYCRRELFDFFEAVLGYSGPFEDKKGGFSYSTDYLVLLTLIETGYVVTRRR